MNNITGNKRHIIFSYMDGNEIEDQEQIDKLGTEEVNKEIQKKRKMSFFRTTKRGVE